MLFDHVLPTAGVTASLVATLVTLAAPAAQAQPFPGGVSCSETTCRNDTDHHYLVESWQHCRVVDTHHETWVPFNVMLPPHETVRVTGVECRPLVIERKDPDSRFPPQRTLLTTEPAGITYSRAVPYDPNAHRAPTGSAL